MPSPLHVAVIDIGKTNAKVALVDLASHSETAVLKVPNAVLKTPPYPHYDTEGLWDFILASLKKLQAEHHFDAVSVTTHGASAVLLDEAEGLATPMLDYEHAGPDMLAATYDALRPGFAVTGSPRLPMGLNVGAQLHWLLDTQPGLRDRLARVVTYPQYWVGRLTGIWCSEVTSLGCHTDLWEPYAGRYSALVERLGLAGRMAPVRKAGDLIGPVLPVICAATGIAEGTPVFCGIHDSNASLYPHLLDQTPPFSVLSTGTWVIAMAMGGAEMALDPTRDTLVNVNALGKPVPSARFMGGREFELITENAPAEPTAAELTRVIDRQILLLPSVVPGSGPFPRQKTRWTHDPAALSPGERTAVVSLYLGQMAATCLQMIGASGPTLAEGPFARNAPFLDALATATERPVLLPGGSDTGTSIGAALLAAGGRAAGPALPAIARPAPEDRRHRALEEYAARWRAALTDQKEHME